MAALGLPFMLLMLVIAIAGFVFRGYLLFNSKTKAYFSSQSVAIRQQHRGQQHRGRR